MAELLNSAIADDLSAAGAKAKYDENIRNILSNKSILAWILKYTTDEFSEYDIPKIMECIENPEVPIVRKLSDCAMRIRFRMKERLCMTSDSAYISLWKRANILKRMEITRKTSSS